MSRYTGPRLKIIRHLGAQLPGLMRTDPELRRAYPPGQHGPNKRKKTSDYGLRLNEKQKLRFHYGVSEKQLRRYVDKAFSSKENSGVVLLSLLERRLDNVVFRAGYAPSMAAARQMVSHGHINVNGHRTDIPSYAVRVGDVVVIREKSGMKDRAVEATKDPNNLKLPEYLERADDTFASVRVKAMPSRDDVPVIVEPQLIVEYYSGR